MDRFILKVGLISMFSFFSTFSYAIDIKVTTSTENVTGIGFTVNGEQHGGLGNSYDKNNMPEGMYSFGLRYNGQDISCLSKEGKEQIKITKDTTATLILDNGKCTLEMQS